MTAGRLTAIGRPMPSYAKPSARSSGGIEHVAPVDDSRVRIRAAGLGPVELAELRPLGHDDGRVRTVERVERRLRDLDAVEVDARRRRRGPTRCTSAPSASSRPASTRLGASRMSSVPGLNARPEERDLLAPKRAEPALELADHAPLLELVHLDDGVQELEVVARVRRELLERERVLRKAAAAEPDPGAQERGADPAVEADALARR